MPARFATRTNLGLNRPPAIWFIRRFLDPQAEILFFPAETALEDARRAGAVAFHIPGAELHVNKELRRTTLDALMAKYGWAGRDAALDLVAEIVRDASFGVPAGDVRHVEAHGLRFLDGGFRATHFADAARVEALSRVYDALYEAAKKRLETAATRA